MKMERKDVPMILENARTEIAIGTAEVDRAYSFLVTGDVEEASAR
jgi:hypothetical protein